MKITQKNLGMPFRNEESLFRITEWRVVKLFVNLMEKFFCLGYRRRPIEQCFYCQLKPSQTDYLAIGMVEYALKFEWMEKKREKSLRFSSSSSENIFERNITFWFCFTRTHFIVKVITFFTRKTKNNNN